jgi:hypothetical protein
MAWLDVFDTLRLRSGGVCVVDEVPTEGEVELSEEFGIYYPKVWYNCFDIPNKYYKGCLFCKTKFKHYEDEVWDENYNCKFCGAPKLSAFECNYCHNLYFIKTLDAFQIIKKPGIKRRCNSCEIEYQKSLVHICPICRKKIKSINYLCDDCNTNFNKNEISRIYQNNQRTKLLNLPSTLNIYDWLNILEKYDYRCAYCGGKYEVLEHIKPVSKGGGTTKNNVVPACNKCNNSLKGNKLYIKMETLTV